ncbi:uncharacterized protein LOC128668771 isoform X2 [Microplitis demolitor]|nr:uncharacterized protein LOC128668771 isoform X2 [Microplitis demolitor]XP_053598420.1 uncharacterized protein LOC128668771 isoform X2 [Microplitis demolitor]
MIFRKIRSSTLLMKLREVHKYFSEKINGIFEDTCMWKNLCTPRIESWIYNILKLKYPYSILRGTDVLSHKNFKDHYISFQKWRRVLTLAEPNINVDYKNFFLENEEITCTDVFAGYIIFGTNLGRVHYAEIPTPDLLFLTAKFKNPISEIKFWFTDSENILIAIVTESKDLKFWHWSRNKEISPSITYGAHHIDVGLDNRCFVMHNLNFVEFKYVDNRLFPMRQCRIPYDNLAESRFLSMYNLSNKFIVMVKNGAVIIVYEINFPSTYSEDLTLEESYISNYNMTFNENKYIASSIPIKESGFVMNEEEILVTDKYLEQEWVHYKLNKRYTDATKGKLVHGSMFANIYFLCWDSGMVDKVTIKKTKNKTGFVIKKFKKSLTFNEPIIAINFTESNNNLYAIFTTKRSSYYFTK